MKKINKKETLADKIANILTAAPATLDPEDQDDDTRAKLNDPLEENENYESEEELLSKFRKQNLDLLSDIDIRYAGKGGSRRDFSNSSELPEDNVLEHEEQEDNEDGGSNSESGNSTETEETEDEYKDTFSLSDDDTKIRNDRTYKQEGPDTFKHIKDTDISAHVKKGMCVRNQLSLWENLLEMRIQIQKCLVASNKMPQSEKYQEIKHDCGAQFTNRLRETQNSVSNLLEKLLLLQKLVLKRYPETKNLENKNNEQQVSASDEEIPSDTENESLHEDLEVEKEEESPRKKRKLQEFEKDIDSQHNNYKSYRNSVIQKWHNKTRIIMTKNHSNPHSIISHIEQVLSDKNKLIKRTQLKKSDFKILGQENDTDETITNSSEEFKSMEEYNTNVFDDDDFYHQLLRELIEVKSADLTDPVQLGRQWMQLQSLRSKMKRKVDTKATKGRKIRYAVHTKLVNYMASIEENSWTDEAKTELYSSLFGKNQLSVN